eukprot:CAMPEP_0201867498 /NCGR_PEP_ID=MMETSP0902-20130614/1699_1 /ASSEMBLY_ACC=CAM_ASM_000551 /TAXON_ID=420261 /ORGANISM="Thalassiosira antarctica, Strain CCMP982" /LENGTH=320 /DNA_ID=CAMNT_0048392653 /DNA_START=375 /DNA_END=1337 /DNA_ORIENTATION=+
MMITNPSKEGARFHSNGFAPAGHPSAATTQVIGAPNSMHGTKRGLASCREELERSWQGVTQPQQFLRCVTNDVVGSSYMEDSLESNSRVKRRKTLQSNYSNDDIMMESSFVGGKRISPFNRPQVQVQQPQALMRSQVKAGWYEGEVDAPGNRHGKGITKHDDGTEYEGIYVNDVMEGSNGRYKFATTRHLVPNPRHNGSHLHRQIETSFEGSFKNDVPTGVGMIITKTVDCAPQALGSTPVDVRFMEVMYDVGMHNEEVEGKAVGEGVRIIYTTTNIDGRSTLEKNCFRLNSGENTNMRVAAGYAAWMLQAMNVDFPVPS